MTNFSIAPDPSLSSTSKISDAIPLKKINTDTNLQSSKSTILPNHKYTNFEESENLGNPNLSDDYENQLGNLLGKPGSSNGNDNDNGNDKRLDDLKVIFGKVFS